MQYPDYLMHHGVKGMKWGVRKNPLSRAGYALARSPMAKVGLKAGQSIKTRRANRIAKRRAKIDRYDRSIEAEQKMSPAERRKKHLRTAAKVAGVAAGVGLAKYALDRGATKGLTKIYNKYNPGGVEGLARAMSGGKYGGKDIDKYLRKSAASSAIKTGTNVAGAITVAKMAQRSMANRRIRNKRHQEKMQRRK